MYQHLTDWETHAENMQISVCFCKTCICLKNLENIQISVNMINRRYYWWILSEMWFYLEYSYFYWRSIKYFTKKIVKM